MVSKICPPDAMASSLPSCMYVLFKRLTCILHVHVVVVVVVVVVATTCMSYVTMYVCSSSSSVASVFPPLFATTFL